jgi:hypothetical protein
MAGFDRNQVADINRNARPTSSESAYKPLIKQKYVKEKLEEETLAAVLVFLSLKAPTHTNYSRVQIVGGGIECQLEHAGPAGALVQINGDVRGRTLDVRFSSKPIPLE